MEKVAPIYGRVGSQNVGEPTGSVVSDRWLVMWGATAGEKNGWGQDGMDVSWIRVKISTVQRVA
jgi:hypothetical protein